MKSLAQSNSSPPRFTAQDLLKGLFNNEFILHYQPVVDGRNRAVIGFEALIRWQHKQYGLLYPDAFIDVLESNECIHQFGRIVIDKAIQQTKQWQKEFQKPLHVSVNVTDRQFIHEDFIGFIIETFKRHHFNPSNLTLELTERTTSDLSKLKSSFDTLRNLGVKIAMDDFGKGFNCMYHLQQLPIDRLKIDRDFVLSNPTLKERIVMNGIISIARQLNMDVIMEGIETEENHLEYRRVADYLQGYFYSKPLAVADVTKALFN